MSDEGIPYSSCAWIDIESVRVLAVRISYVGELGWELHVPFEQGAHLWDILMAAGRPFGIAPVGLAAYGGTLRVEKSYRLMSAELELDRNLVEAGLAGPGSRTRTSSAGRRTSPSEPRARPACCAP